MKQTLFGFLVVDKPRGVTSRAAVDVVKKLIRPTKIGHAGTLDPLATGALVLCIGPATRLTQFVQQMPKTYIADFQFGVRSETDDIESEIMPVDSAVEFSLDQLQHRLGDFLGDIQQTPPMYSAVKVEGRRAYALSRAGREFKLQPKTVTVHNIEVLEFNYPNLKVNICCGSGTYIRSIGRDLGKSLSSAAVMTALNRTAIGKFDLETAIATEHIDIQKVHDKLITPLAAFPSAPKTVLDMAQIERLRDGHLFEPNELSLDAASNHSIAIDQNKNLLAVFSRHHSGNFKPELNFISYY